MPSSILPSYNTLLHSLPSAEQLKIEAYLKSSDKIASLVGAKMLRLQLCLLSTDPSATSQKNCNRSDQILTSTKTPQHSGIFCRLPIIRDSLTKRPYTLKGPDFNLSHHGSLCVSIASTACKVGIDVTTIDESITESFDAFEKILSKREWDWINGSKMLSPPSPSKHFAVLWALKEAYVKNIGVGLAYPDLAEVEFIIGKELVGHSRVYLKDSELLAVSLHLQGSVVNDWYFEVWEVDGDVIAVALGVGWDTEVLNLPLHLHYARVIKESGLDV